MYLVDTNVFIEILLKQEKKDKCKAFLDKNSDSIYMTDFSLHSIGVICFKSNKEDMFQKFLEDTLSHVELLTLPLDQYAEIIKNRKLLNLDFDDSYQYTTAKNFDLAIATMDNDFKKVTAVDVLFL
jgi:uncharacterized protein